MEDIIDVIEAPTGRTHCDGCLKVIEKGQLHLRIQMESYMRSIRRYWCKECARIRLNKWATKLGL